FKKTAVNLCKAGQDLNEERQKIVPGILFAPFPEQTSKGERSKSPRTPCKRLPLLNRPIQCLKHCRFEISRCFAWKQTGSDSHYSLLPLPVGYLSSNV